MPLSSDFAVNRLKLSNTAGKITENTGLSQLFSFKLKPKTQTTLRNIFGECSWADPFSFSDYAQAIDRFDLATANLVYITSPLVDTQCGAIIYYASIGDGVLDAMTGVEVSGITFLATSTFTHDIGNVPVSASIFTAQSSVQNIDVSLVNGNRMFKTQVA